MNNSVGKTSIINRYVNNEFSDTYKATIGSDFLIKPVTYKGNQYTLQVCLYLIIQFITLTEVDLGYRLIFIRISFQNIYSKSIVNFIILTSKIEYSSEIVK